MPEIVSTYMPERISEYVPERMSEYIYIYIMYIYIYVSSLHFQMVCQKPCQNNCQGGDRLIFFDNVAETVGLMHFILSLHPLFANDACQR